MGGIQLGNVAEWIGGLGAAAAFVLAYRVYREEVARRHADERLPAMSVSISAEEDHHANSPYPDVIVFVHNGSVMPMRMARVVLDVDGTEHSEELGELGADRRDEVVFSSIRDEGPMRASVVYTDPWGRRWERPTDGPAVEVDPSR